MLLILIDFIANITNQQRKTVACRTDNPFKVYGMSQKKKDFFYNSLIVL